jgi:hypothetical protein
LSFAVKMRVNADSLFQGRDSLCDGGGVSESAEVLFVG